MRGIGIKKSGLIAAFFLLSISSATTAAEVYAVVTGQNIAERLKLAAVAGHLDQSPVWHALLHAKNGHPNIHDANFLLSLPDFSPLEELQKTIDFLYRGEPENVCRFPARYLWLQKQLTAPELPLAACPDVIEFRQKAPLDEIALVFASENIAQPASMLGHAFLKFSGKNEQGQEVSHAISFYTDANTLNLPRLLFDSLIIGKKGYFSLSPYPEKQQRYLDEEQRSIWEYQLVLDKFQKELIRLHLLELKQSRLTYFFQKYNCATLLDFILGLSGKPIPDSGWWVTPKGLIKNAYQAGLIDGTRVLTPSRWLVRALAEQVPVSEQRSLRDQVRQGNVANHIDYSGSTSAFIRLELTREYNRYVYLNGELDKNIWGVNEHALDVAKTRSFPEMALTADQRYNPINAPGESQIFLATQNDAGEAALAFTVLPISHTLSDDNRNYTSETSLQLFSPTFKLTLPSSRLTLDRLVIYDAESLMPYDELTGGISGRFHLAVEPQKNSRLEARHILAISGALGLTRRIEQDIDFYSLAGGGLGYTGTYISPYTTIEAGAILRELWDMKSLLSLTHTNNQIDGGAHYYSINFDHSKFIDRTLTVNLDWKWDFNNQHQQHFIAIGLKKIF